MSTSSLYGTDQQSEALALLGGDVLGDTLPNLLKQAVVAAANNAGGGGGGSGTVTSVAIAGSNGIQVNSGSPITTAGTIQLGVNAATMKSTLDLSGTNTGDQNLFGIIAVAGQSNVVAENTNDTLTLVAGTNVYITTDATTDTITINATGGAGGGDVTGPASATNNALVRFDGTTGKFIQNGTVTQSDSGDLAVINSLSLNTAPTGTLSAQGQIQWNPNEETFDVQLNSFVMHNGEHMLYHVKNSTGSTIAKGTPVMFAGTNGASGILLVQPWNGTGPSTYFMGITGEELLDTEQGFVVAFGKIRGIQTDGGNYGETWADGQIIYASTTTGYLTKTQPAAPNPHIQVCAVINAHASNGTLFIRPTLGSNIKDDEGVTITSLASGQVLIANAAGTVFENKSLSGDLTLTNTGATTLATVNSNVGTFGSATKTVTATINGKGLVTAISEQTVTPAVGSITGLGANVASNLGNAMSGTGTIARTADITKTAVGLGNCDNTSDMDKPVSTAQQTALNLKQDHATTLDALSTGYGSSLYGGQGIVQWNGTTYQMLASALGSIYGGTGVNSYAEGDILYGNSSSSLSKLSGNTSTTPKFLKSTGTGTAATAPTYSTISSTDVGLSNVTNDTQTKAAIVPNTPPSSGQILAGNAGGTAYTPVSVSADATLASTGALTLATVNSNVGSFGSATAAPAVTVNAKGLVTAVTTNTITPAVGSITGLGTNVATSLANNLTSSGTLALTSDITKVAVGLGNVTNDAQTKASVVPNTSPSAGQILVGNAGGTAYAPVSASGGMTISSSGVVTIPAVIQLACSDETTALTTGTAKVTFRMPHAMTVTVVRLSVTTAPTGSALIVDVKQGGTSIFSTKPQIDAGSYTSVGGSTPGVISTSALTDDAQITINLNQIGSTVAGTGLKVSIIGTRS